jgi:Yip1 domain
MTVPAPERPPAVSKNVVARLLGVLFSPRSAYADVAASPRWLGALLIVVIISGGSTFAFLSTDIGKNAMLDQQMRTMESFGIKVNDQAVQRMESSAARAPYFGAVSQAILLPIAAAALAGVLFAIFNAILGGDAKYKQVFAVVVHSGAIVALGALFVLPIDYFRESLSSPTTLLVFLPFLDENSFVARLFGWIDLVRIWWFVSLAIGLGVLYRKRTGPIAMTLLALYGAIALVIAAIQSAVSGA